jgi:hypothetical protein
MDDRKQKMVIKEAEWRCPWCNSLLKYKYAWVCEECGKPMRWDWKKIKCK